MTTFPQVLARLLAADPGRPLVTFYDDATGERTELSVTTWANWVAKVASLLGDELDVEHGSRLLVDLPPTGSGRSCSARPGPAASRWSGTVGADAVGHRARTGLDRWAERGRPHPGRGLGAAARWRGRFPDGVPTGVHDLGVEVWSQPDAYAAWPGPSPDDAAVAGTTQAELWRSAAAGDRVSGGDRLLSEANPASPSGLASLTEPLVSHGSLVLVAHVSAERRERIAADERVTARYPARS